MYNSSHGVNNSSLRTRKQFLGPGILDYFTLMESQKTKNLLSKFTGGGNPPPRNHAWDNHWRRHQGQNVKGQGHMKFEHKNIKHMAQMSSDNGNSSGGCAYVFLCFHFNFMQKFCFQYQFEGKSLENNFGPSVKLSDKKNQNGHQNARWLPISEYLGTPL